MTSTIRRDLSTYTHFPHKSLFLATIVAPQPSARFQTNQSSIAWLCREGSLPVTVFFLNASQQIVIVPADLRASLRLLRTKRVARIHTRTLWPAGSVQKDNRDPSQTRGKAKATLGSCLHSSFFRDVTEPSCMNCAGIEVMRNAARTSLLADVCVATCARDLATDAHSARWGNQTAA